MSVAQVVRRMSVNAQVVHRMSVSVRGQDVPHRSGVLAVAVVVEAAVVVAVAAVVVVGVAADGAPLKIIAPAKTQGARGSIGSWAIWSAAA
jgi:hypothetical protein